MQEEEELTWEEEWIREGERRAALKRQLKGLREGELKVLRRQLESRFEMSLPGRAEERLAAATEDEILGWSVQLLQQPALSLGPAPPPSAPGAEEARQADAPGSQDVTVLKPSTLESNDSLGSSEAQPRREGSGPQS